MKKILFTILGICITSFVFSQEKKVEINLNEKISKCIIVTPKTTISVLIYPELSRNGLYRILNKKKQEIYTDEYKNVDVVNIDLSTTEVLLKKGIYILEFTADTDEIEYVKLKVK